ncbi:MAG: alpha/beta fold hydrolase [Chloroflexi bacterium]|nr:alpha/beta fold hydrolase [Chloroflexota bacterium]
MLINYALSLLVIALCDRYTANRPTPPDRITAPLPLARRWSIGLGIIALIWIAVGAALYQTPTTPRAIVAAIQPYQPTVPNLARGTRDAARKGAQIVVWPEGALAGLEDHFVVVNWEQPGAGKSFDAVDRSTLTPERYIADARELIGYLQQRFGEEKVYVLGESWGSALGIMVAQRYPEVLHAFVGTGQMVAFLENDLICYDFALQLAQVRGDVQKVEQLKRQGPPPYYDSDVALKSATYLMETFDYMNANPAIADDGFNTFSDLAGSEYGLYDKVNWFRGVLDTFGVVYPQLWDVDFRTQASKLDVPVYFLIGRHDVNAPPQLTEEYYQLLDAPHKELIWFEHSGHNPWVHESARFVDVMVNTVLAQTQPDR